MRDSLKQADAEDLDLSWTHGPKPASEGLSVDFVSEANEIWNRHHVPPSLRMFARGTVFPTASVSE
jgi:hypothetical protein